jgi:hypothetical protein
MVQNTVNFLSFEASLGCRLDASCQEVIGVLKIRLTKNMKKAIAQNLEKMDKGAF